MVFNFISPSVLSLYGVTLFGQLSSASLLGGRPLCRETIERDVTVIGGGSAGIFSAIYLKDRGISTIVIEKDNRLGGHAETYFDPETGISVDYGVVVFHNISVVTNYFDRFQVPLVGFGGDELPRATYDLATGKPAHIESYSEEALSAAFAKYGQVLAQWPGLIEGMFLPEPIPDDLIMPFGEFAKKHGIEAIVSTLYRYNPGQGDIRTIPTIEMIRVSGIPALRQFAGGFLTTARHDVSEIYVKARDELLSAHSLLLSSTAKSVRRHHRGVQLTVSTPHGIKCIKSKKLLIAIPPKLDILSFMDLHAREKSLFAKFLNGGYFTGILKNTGIPSNLSITNAVESSPFHLPSLPATYTFPTCPIPGHHIAFSGAARTAASFPISESAAKASMIEDLKRLQAISPDVFEPTEPEFVVFAAHAPFYLQVKAEDTKAGFYKDLYKLQGERNTFWTGAAWVGEDSSRIWQYSTDHVLPKLVESLRG